MLGSGDSDQTI